MTEPLRCIGEPVSWLRLERYHLGELDVPVRAAVAEHLAACPACAACLRHIENDDASPLPSFELPPPRPAAHVPEKRGRLLRLSSPRALSAVGGLALAAALMLGVGRKALHGPGSNEAGSPRVKGGEVAFTLVRDDGERVEGERGVFGDGDRWKVLVTCPPSMHPAFYVVVFDRDGASFPLKRVPALACGNEIPVPGALRLTGTGEERVCVVWGDDATLDQAKLTEDGKAVGAESRCKVLRPRTARDGEGP